MSAVMGIITIIRLTAIYFLMSRSGYTPTPIDDYFEASGRDLRTLHQVERTIKKHMITITLVLTSVLLAILTWWLCTKIT